jgi:hypothetical protein
MLHAALGRPADASEIASFADLVHTMAAQRNIPLDEALESPDVWKDVAHVILNLKEFIYIP